MSSYEAMDDFELSTMTKHVFHVLDIKLGPDYPFKSFYLLDCSPETKMSHLSPLEQSPNTGFAL